MSGNQPKPSGHARSTRSSIQRANPGKDLAETSAPIPIENDSDSASTVEEETRNTIPTADNNDELREEIERLQAQISRLTQERSPIPSTESDPKSSRQPYHTPVVRF
jgi:hypothetical protein